MSVTDPIGDMLTRIRNAVAVQHDVVLMPASNMKIAIARNLREEGFIGDYEVVRGGAQRTLRIRLNYREKKQPVITGLQRVSKPGLRVYVQKGEAPRVYGGIGIAILSTSKGVMTGQQAWHAGVGGEVLCYVW